MNRNTKENCIDIFTLSCSELSITVSINEPGEVDCFEFLWLSIKNSTGLPGDGVRAVVS